MENLLSKEKNVVSEYHDKVTKQYNFFKQQNLKLDMSRGKPCPEQLDLSNKMLESDFGYISKTGIDCRNYGGIDGLPEAKEIFSQMLDINNEQLIIGGNSSLNLMHDTMLRAMVFGTTSQNIPWSGLPKIKFLCPSPGYDRHFSICELFGIEMITVAMNNDGPDIDQIQFLVEEDSSIKGMWCVPMYSNPDGITYSDNIVNALANLKTKVDDFRIFWDNAYAVHHLSDKPDKLKNIITACEEANNADRVYVFSSTSKITFAGGGISMVASSKNNIDRMKKQLSIQTIGPDKLNQLRHVKFFKDLDGIKLHMQKHAKILKPKFDMCFSIMEEQLSPLQIAKWNKPNGGYFISLNTLDGCAKKVIKYAKEAGVIMTDAGATYPYKNDPYDKNIRIAPSYPSVDELKKAMELLCTCIKIVTCEKILKIN